MSGGLKKVIVVNYFAKPPPQADAYYYEKIIYMLLMIRREVFDQTPMVPMEIIGARVKETEVRTMAITIKRVNMFDIGIKILTITSTETTILT